MSARDIKAGDRVVCIDDSPCRCCGDEMPFRVGDEFTVSFARSDVNKPTGEQVRAIGLEGLVSPETRHPDWRGTNAERFRKIEAPETEIAARIRACNPAKVSA